jgi:DNA-binding transcriptional ArsR family regulator
MFRIDLGKGMMKSLPDNVQRAEQIAEMLKALSHPLRIRILAVLSESGQKNVTGLATRLGASQSFVSRQLGVLRTHGLLVGSRVGQSVQYTLARPRLRDLVKYLEGCPD